MTFLKLNKESYHYSKVHNIYLFGWFNNQAYMQQGITFFLYFNHIRDESHNTTLKSTAELTLEPIFLWMIREMKITTTLFSTQIPYPPNVVLTYNRENGVLFSIGLMVLFPLLDFFLVIIKVKRHLEKEKNLQKKTIGLEIFPREERLYFRRLQPSSNTTRKVRKQFLIY